MNSAQKRTRTQKPLLANDLSVFGIGMLDEVIGRAQNGRTKAERKEKYIDLSNHFKQIGKFSFLTNKSSLKSGILFQIWKPSYRPENISIINCKLENCI